MSEALDVYLHGNRAGRLERRSQAKLSFALRRRLGRGGGLPDLTQPAGAGAGLRSRAVRSVLRGTAAGDFLKAISRTLHVSARNPFQLLAEIGGECAGGDLGRAGRGPVPGKAASRPRWLSEGELGALLGDLPDRPLLGTIDEEDGFRISLAGAQDKVGVLFDGRRIGLSRGRPPSTDIVKAPIPGVFEPVANEAFCGTAAAVGLDVAAATPRSAAGQEYLLVHRYDRDEAARPDGRIHQEDFCQALGLVPAVKYENEGGPKVADCAGLISRHSAAPARDIIAFLDALLFNFAIGNNDAHSKNYSLLLDGNGAVRLAPLYDLLSIAVIEGASRALAMRYGGEKAALLSAPPGTCAASPANSTSGRPWSSAAPPR